MASQRQLSDFDAQTVELYRGLAQSRGDFAKRIEQTRSALLDQKQQERQLQNAVADPEQRDQLSPSINFANIKGEQGKRATFALRMTGLTKLSTTWKKSTK